MFNKFITGLELVAKDPFTNNDNIYNSSNGVNKVEGSSAENAEKVAEPQQLLSQAAPSYKEKLYKETIELMTEGVFSLAQLCQVVSILSRFDIPEDPVGLSSKQHCLSDKFWAGM